MNWKIYLSPFFLTFLVTCTARAEVTTIDSGSKIYSVPNNKIWKKIPDDKHTTILGLSLGKASLADVQKKLGVATLQRIAEQQPYFLCYRSSKIADNTVLIFEAGPLGGWEVITSFSVYSDISARKDLMNLSCTQSPIVSSRITTDGGLSLALIEKSLRALLGEPSAKSHGNILYVYEKVVLHPQTNKELSRDVMFEAVYVNGLMKSFTVSKTESY